MVKEYLDNAELSEAVEKALKEREEKKRLSMRTSPTEKQNSVKKASTSEKKDKMKHIDMILMLSVIAGLLIWGFWPVLMPEEVEPENVIVYPANVVLDSFEDVLVLHFTKPGNNGPLTVRLCDYVSVTFQLKNTGDEVAKDVSCFIKCCNQNGTILFAQMFTFGDLGPDAPGKIPAMVSYNVPISDGTLYVVHNIDIRWSPQGVNTYMKLTDV